MTNAHSLPDYKEKYFETKALDRIHGKPTLPQIIKIYRQLKRNAQRIPTRLGGGKHGYLAIVIGTTKFDAMTGTSPFVTPTDPGIFTPQDITTTTAGVATRAATTAATTTTRAPNSAELAQQKAQYDDELRLFLEVETVETLLRNMLLAAFDDDYTKALRDANDMIRLSIPKVMEYLIKVYGKIKPEEFRELKKEVEEFIYDPVLPIDVLFNKVDFSPILPNSSKNH